MRRRIDSAQPADDRSGGGILALILLDDPRLVLGLVDTVEDAVTVIMIDAIRIMIAVATATSTIVTMTTEPPRARGCRRLCLQSVESRH